MLIEKNGITIKEISKRIKGEEYHEIERIKYPNGICITTKRESKSDHIKLFDTCNNRILKYDSIFGFTAIPNNEYYCYNSTNDFYTLVTPLYNSLNQNNNYHYIAVFNKDRSFIYQISCEMSYITARKKYADIIGIFPYGDSFYIVNKERIITFKL